ncbi:Retrovirus-related Pol polyprotein, partial [Mucuna pruriens]
MNPTILDVVKNEVTKLLATGIIYPILDSQWVSPMQDCMEVFMDDFTIYANSFDACLENLSKVLTRCIDTNLVLNFEKCHFMVTEGIVLRHLVSNRGIEVDKSKIDIITTLPNLACTQKELKNRLTSAPILQAPNWELPFELMCNASNSAFGAVLPQRAGVGKPVHELLAIVFALDKFHPYLLGSKIVVFSNHAALRFLLKKPDAKSRLIRWMLLLQEFNIEIRDKKGVENSIADHLSRIRREDDLMPIRDEFPDEQLLYITMPTRWFEDICNVVATLQCIPDMEINSVLQFCHAAPRGGDYGSTRIARKVLDCGFYWPTIFKYAYQFVSTYEKCQKAGVAITRRHEMPQQLILFYEIFYVRGINFMGPFPISNGYSYILLVVDYVSRWVEAIADESSRGSQVQHMRTQADSISARPSHITRPEIEKPKSVRGDRLGFQRTPVELILSAQATGGEPPPLTKLCADNSVASFNDFAEPGQMENYDRTLKELATPDVPQLELAQTYELKSGLIHLLPKFHGLAEEDPYKHLKEFHVVCSTMRPQGILEDYIKIKAFPFSLDGAVKDWLYL